MLIDEHPAPGGQIYRGVERAGGDPANSPLGADYLAGRPLAAALPRQRASDYRPATTLWHLDPDGGRSSLLERGGAHARCCGAPRPAGDRRASSGRCRSRAGPCPGVMTAGAAQILLKTADLVPDGRAVLAGQGPLLYLPAVAARPRRRAAGALLETTPRENMPRRGPATRRRCWPGAALLAKGLGCARRSPRRHPDPARRHAACARSGRRRLERVAWDGGELAADHLLLHEGVIPNTQISLGPAARARLGRRRSSAGGRGVDAWGRTSLPEIAIAGDGAGIAGAEAAALAGRLAALDAARGSAGSTAAERDRRAAPIRARARPRSWRCGRFSTRSTARPPVLAPADDDVSPAAARR